jgi:hypothetical protein
MPDDYIPWSERECLVEVRTQIQDSGMDKGLRVDLWNALHATVLDHPEASVWLPVLWSTVLRLPIDEFDEERATGIIKNAMLHDTDWHLACDILQFFAERLSQGTVYGFTGNANRAFHRGKFAWHFVGRQLVRYIGEAETKALSMALQDSQPFPEVRRQLDTALAEFSARENPNYGHAAKEAISALETLVKQVVGDPRITLGAGIKAVRRSGRPAIHPALLDSFEKLWGYASDKGYLRHGGKPGEGLEGVTMEDAQLVLVSCAAIISFLTARAQAERILGST